MHPILAGTALVRMLGIIVLTNQVPNDCGTHAILPRLIGDPMITMAMQQNPAAPAARIARPATISLTNAHSPYIEKHQSVIIFQTSARHPSSSWGNVKPFPFAANTSYVEIDGERLRFVANNNNPAADLAIVDLPHIRTQCCAAFNTFNSGFLPPYRGAAAVIDIPFGAIKACKATTSQPNKERADTEIRLNYDGPYFVISASTMTTTKELRITGTRPTVIIANVPQRWIDLHDDTPKNAQAIDGVPHYHAYYNMGAGAATACSQSLDTCGTHPSDACESLWLQYAGKPGKGASTGDAVTVARAGNNNDTADPMMPNRMMVDFQCSNSQWP